jgi:hypothetical protein
VTFPCFALALMPRRDHFKSLSGLTLHDEIFASRFMDYLPFARRTSFAMRD